jgi:hypothetical protein
MNHSHPLSKDMVACWLMNEGNGDKIYDSSGNGLTGTMLNMSHPPVATSGWNPAKYGKGIAFDGVETSDGDYIKIPANKLFNFGNASGIDTPFSLTFSVLFRSLSLAYNFIYGNYSPQHGYNMDVHDSTIENAIFFNVASEGNDSNEIWARSNESMVVNNWYKITMTYNGGSVPGSTALYINGKASDITYLGSGTYVAMAIDIQDLNLGIYSPSTRHPASMTMDHFMIYRNRVLTPQEALQLYTEPFCMFND